MRPVVATCVVGLVVLVILLVLRGAGQRTNVQSSGPAGKPADGKFISVVLLLKRPVEVSREQFLDACGRAFGQRPDAQDIVQPPPPGKFIVRRGESAMALLVVDQPYVKDQGAVAERLQMFELKQLMQEHTAWLSVDFLGDLPAGGKAQAYRWVGTITASLMGPDCIGVYNVETQELNVVRPDTAALLCSSTPLKAFAYVPKDEVIHVPTGDAEMQAATDEAKRRWPEFVAAFGRKRPMQGFGVKTPFATSGGGQEHMWVEVQRIEGNTLSGKIANDPEDVPGMKLGDVVSVKVEDVEDWIYDDGKRMVGGFTAEVLKRREAGQR